MPLVVLAAQQGLTFRLYGRGLLSDPAAYAEAGQFDNAVATVLNARAIAAASGRQALARQIDQRIALYPSGRPYRRQPGVE